MTVWENAYIGTDGLLWCSICNTRREKILEVVGHTYKTRIRCQCQSFRDEQDRAERRKREQMDSVARLRSSSLQDRCLSGYLLANDNGSNPKMEIARRYLENWSEMEISGRGCCCLAILEREKALWLVALPTLCWNRESWC